MGSRTARAAAAVLAIALAPLAAGAQDAAPAHVTAPALLARLADDPTLPGAYRATIDLHARLRVFPFIHVHLRGDSTFRRPGLYRFVFKDAPLIARAWSDIRYDLGDPATWAQRYDVALAPNSTDAVPVLRLVPHSAQQVKWLDVWVDPQKGHLDKAVWSRKDGGTITLVQRFAARADREMVDRQTATIDLPHMKAELSADYTDFQVGAVPEDR